MKKKRLGKGLSALLPVSASKDVPNENNEEKKIKNHGRVIEVELKKIKANPWQPRRSFSKEKLQELAASIKEHGLLQPIILCQKKDGNYSLVAGERRYRAAILAGMNVIPAVIKELSSAETLEIALVENLQREDLNPIEEARAYKQLLEDFNFTQEQLAARISKSRPAIANMLRLLKLPAKILEVIAAGQISVGHARTLLALETQKEIEFVFSAILEQDLSVRSTEELVNTLKKNSKKNNKKQKMSNKASPPRGKSTNRDPFLVELENQMCHYFGCQVKIKKNLSGEGGKIEIVYFNATDLDRINDLLAQSALTHDF